MGLARRTHAAALVALALCIWLVVIAPASGEMRWLAPATLGEGRVDGKGLHMDARGNLLAVWQRQGEDGRMTTSYSWKPVRQGWTSEHEFAPPISPGARIAIALIPRGDATAVWSEGGKVFTAEAEVGRAFGNARVLGRTDPRATRPVDVVVDDGGNAVAAWAGEYVEQTGLGGPSGWRIYTATRSTEGAWSDPQPIPDSLSGAGPDVAMNSAGAAVVGWAESINLDPHIAYRVPGGSFGPAERVPSEHWGIPIVAIGEGGEAVVATASRSHVTADPWRALMAVRRPLGDWEEPLSFPTNNAPHALFVAPDGTATMFMNDSSDRDHPQAQYVTRSAAGALHGPVTVAADRIFRGIAANLRGDLLATLGTTSGADPIEFSERPHGSSAFGPRLPAPGAVGGAAVALNDAGQAAMLWDSGPPPGRVRVAVRDDPALPVPPAPPTVAIDSPDAPQLDGEGFFRVAVRCSTRCKAVPRAILAAGGNEQLVAGAGPSRRIAAKRHTVLKIRFGSQQSRAVLKAIRAGRRPWVSVSVRARGKSPRPITVSRRFRLR